MSTDYVPGRAITAADLFSGRLEKHGVREIIVEPKSVRELAAKQGYELPPGASEMLIPGTTERKRCLTDGTNYLSVKITQDGFVDIISRNGGNKANTILNAITQEFDTDIFSEHDAEFWEGLDCGFGQWFG
jgi:hypothetical protein